MTAHSSRQHLLLIGAGRAHLQVLQGLARQGAAQLRVTLVAPSPFYVDSALLPGYVGGDYGLDDVRRPLDALLEVSGAYYIPAQALALDPVNRRVQLSTGEALPYDVLSVNAEPLPDREAVEQHMPGARQNALFTRPQDAFVQLWPQLLQLAQTRPLHLAVIGQGVASVELALAAAHALAAMPHGSHVTLVAGDAPLLHGESATLQRHLTARLQAMNITVLPLRCVGLDGQGVHLANGAQLLCDAPLLVCDGSDTPAWLAQSGLQVDEQGRPVINERLQSESHRQVFIAPYDAPPDTGVLLEHNLRAALYSGSFKKVPLHPPRLRLRLLHCGGGQALAIWGPLALLGREVWHYKDRRDRKLLAALMAVR